MSSSASTSFAAAFSVCANSTFSALRASGRFKVMSAMLVKLLYKKGASVQLQGLHTMLHSEIVNCRRHDSSLAGDD
jgi:hypothetical protein